MVTRNFVESLSKVQLAASIPGVVGHPIIELASVVHAGWVVEEVLAGSPHRAGVKSSSNIGGAEAITLGENVSLSLEP